MNTAYDEVIASSDADRGALFVETAARLNDFGPFEVVVL